ncbi:MAG: hypothetical protein IPI35_09050 [Deltaproteobacteria bacterium]|nr:hypothetical protein [Deltaproteobacteria bacterium]
MKPVVLYAGAAIVGIGAAIFLFASPMGSSSSGSEGNDETTASRAGGGSSSGPGFGADEGDEGGGDGGPTAKQVWRPPRPFRQDPGPSPRH